MNMKIKIELFGASRDLSDKEFLELDLKGNSSSWWWKIYKI